MGCKVLMSSNIEELVHQFSYPWLGVPVGTLSDSDMVHDSSRSSLDPFPLMIRKKTVDFVVRKGTTILELKKAARTVRTSR